MKKILPFLQSLFLLGYSAFSFGQTLHVNIKGVDENIKENIQLSLNVDHLEKFSTTEEIELFYQTAPAEIKKALRPFGYFNPTIQSSLVSQKEHVTATFNIKLGTPVRINMLDIQLMGEGENDSRFLEVIHNISFKKGDVFSASEYDELHKKLFAVATDLGFFDAHMLKDDLIIDLRNNTANIILYFNTGKRYRFGQITFSKTPFDLSFLKRFVSFSEGDFYNIEKIEKLQEDLVGSNYFKEAWINPISEERENGEIPIKVELKARAARQYNFGLGFGTDTGVRGSTGIEFRRLTSTGHRFNAQMQASEINSSFQMAYTVPGKNPVTDKYFLTSSAEQLDLTLGEGNFQKISAGFTRKPDAWQQTFSLSAQRERSALDGQNFQTQYMLIPNTTWEYISQDDPVKVSRGTHLLFTLQGTPSLLGNIAFAQGIASFKTIQPLGDNRFIARTAVGYTWITDVIDLPLSFQLFAGGTQSVRGYAYNSIGPGSSMAVASVEYRQRVKEDWYATIFFDAGSVSNTFLGDIKKGPGLGAVWQSPVGALALSIARGIDNDSTLIQFSMGQDL